jgi:hypothetical protein
METIAWKSEITDEMVKGWSAATVEQLKKELDDAVERIFSELEMKG